MKTFLIAILNLGVRGEWGGCGVVVLGSSLALIRHVSLALAKFFPSTVQDGTFFVLFRFMFWHLYQEQPHQISPNSIFGTPQSEAYEDICAKALEGKHKT